MHLFFSAGEASGDEHASELMHELAERGPLKAAGFGGPQMLDAGQKQLFPLTELAVMGIGQIAPQLKTFFRLADEAEAYFRDERPDALVLIDYPGFNWHLAKRAKRHGVPVVYYMPPQLWAWAPWRVRKARRSIDLALSGLPFEADWYARRGVPVQHVSHPFFDEVATRELDAATVDGIRRRGRAVALLPGSRNSEVHGNFPVQLQAAKRLFDEHPDVRFHVACYKPAHKTFCEQAIAEQAAGLPIQLHLGRTSEIIDAADACIAVSGSVSLELLARRCPTTMLYKLSLFTWTTAAFLLTTPYITLPNVLAGREVMPEHKFVRREHVHAEALAADVHEWLADDAMRAAKVAELDAIAQQVVRPGGTAAAAEAIESLIASRAQSAADSDSATGDETIRLAA